MSNPVLQEDRLKKLSKENNQLDNGVMTLDGTINKSLLLIMFTIGAAIFSWFNPTLFYEYLFTIIIISIILSLIIIFIPKTSPYLSFLYVIFEGILIGGITFLYEQQFPGIALQTIGLVFLIFVGMLMLYKFKIIKVTDKLRNGIIISTLAIAGIYIISIIGNLTGWYNIPYIHESGIGGIIFSLIIVGIASMNLLLDFDNIEKGIEMKLPKYMEWYMSFGLILTLIWLYLEILKLLGKTRED